MIRATSINNILFHECCSTIYDTILHILYGGHSIEETCTLLPLRAVAHWAKGKSVLGLLTEVSHIPVSQPG